MEKPAVTQVPLQELIARRWSPRAFSSRPIEREKLLGLVEAVRWSASSRNEQPWQLLITAKGSPEFQRLVDCLAPGNAPWAANAPVLILVGARTTFGDGKPNRHAWYDAGFAVSSLTLQALAGGLWVHQMAGFSAEKARETFAVPAGTDPVCVLAIGYYGDPELLPKDRLQQETGPRARKALSDFVYEGKWGHAAGLVKS